MHRLPPSVRRFFDLEAHIGNDDEERNGEEEEEEEVRPFFSPHIKIINYILQIISLTIVHGLLQIN